MKRIYIFLLVIIFFSFSSNDIYSQNIGINADGSTPDANAMLDIKASDKGILIPRTSTTSRTAIPNTKGLLVYDTTLNSFWYNDGVSWQQISNGAALNGTANYLPKFTGTTTVGNSQIVDNGQYIGIGTTNPIAGLNIIHNGGIVAKGDTLSANSYSLAETGAGSKFIWHPKRGALRAGFVDASYGFIWNDDFIGNWSAAFGYDEYATGTACFATGFQTQSTGSYSFSEGYGSEATRIASTAIGYNAKAEGDYSFAQGNGTTAVGISSVAMGAGTATQGNYSFALGADTYSGGTASFALGYNNKAQGDYSFTTGSTCNANGLYSVAMGNFSTAGGFSSVSLGYNNTAPGDFSVAMGDGANASGNYSFVWGVNSNTTGANSFILGKNLFDGGHKGNAMFGDTDPWNAGSVGSGTDDQMICRFNNGYYFLTGGNTNRTGMLANHGDNSWSQISDSTKKENIILVDEETLLQKISKFKLCTWNYKGQDPKTFRHYGPMAQDFHNAFGHDALGTIGNDTLINQADFLGVSFTAIQALEKRTEKIEQQQKQIDNLQKDNEALSTTNEKLQQQLQTLLSTVAALDKKVETLASIENKSNSVAKK
jgi:hypothetical protein